MGLRGFIQKQRINVELSAEALKWQQSEEAKRLNKQLEKAKSELKDAEERRAKIDADNEESARIKQRLIDEGVIEKNRIIAKANDETKLVLESVKKHENNALAIREEAQSYLDRAETLESELKVKIESAEREKQIYYKLSDECREKQKFLDEKLLEAKKTFEDLSALGKSVDERIAVAKQRETLVVERLKSIEENIKILNEVYKNNNAKAVELGKFIKEAEEKTAALKQQQAELDAFKKDIADAKEQSLSNAAYYERLVALEATLKTWEKALTVKDKDLDKREQNIKEIEKTKGV